MTTLDEKLVDIVCDHQSVIRHGTFTTEEFADALREAARAGAEAQRALSKHIDQDGVYEDGDQHNEFECRNFGGRCAPLVTEEKP
jgi:hypothetical protein